MSSARTVPARMKWLARPPLPAMTVLVPLLLAVMAAAGLGVGVYLTYSHWADQAVACGGLGDCELVQNSDYATLGPVPVALLGTLMYLGLGGLALASLWRRPLYADWPMLALWAGALAGVAYSAYLTYVELFVLEAICVYCVVSAVIVTLMWLVSSAYVLALERGRPDEDEGGP